jgi:hypothetical protein
MLSVLGLLLVGAGLCSSVFCGFAFGEVIEARQAVAFALKQAEALQAAVPNSTLAFQGKPMNLAAWQELTREHRHTVLAREVHAYRLATLSIGLILGGTSVGLLGWGLRRTA